ncbi:MAG: indolepyruvate ferredoxin oxidoreductase family protein, partial [Lysobacteraceae bacterium]
MQERVTLDDKYEKKDGYIFLTGVQALVRLPILQRWRDDAAGLNTAGFICGYRGSPLATYDLQLGRASAQLEAHRVLFQPGINEDLALTAVWGSQQAQTRNEGLYDGVYAIWYGKGAGVDRSGDAMRHGSMAGAAPHGGVLMLLGDDHRAESSSVAHQSEFTMIDYQVPVLNPADVREIMDFGLFGIAMSRFSGCWAALKCGHEVVESAASVRAEVSMTPFVVPDFPMPEDGLHLRAPDTPLAQEARQPRKLAAAQAFARANGIDRVIHKPTGARLGIVTTGKPYLDVLEALDDLGIDSARAEELGVALYKVGMPWPLEPEGIEAFCDSLDVVMVIEEKRGVIESQLKELLFNNGRRVTIVGKNDERGRAVLPVTGTLSSNRVAAEIARRLLGWREDAALRSHLLVIEARDAPPSVSAIAVKRLPHFCSGCPHNRSTVVPDGSRGMAGTGCGYMVMWMDRGSDAYAQMGADGANWIGEAPFSKRKHIFQNMGDGTYYHSGILSIRASIAAKVNITYKILFNDAVAMTGGQAFDGPLSVPRIARQVTAEGVRLAVVVTDDPSRYEDSSLLPAGMAVHHRDHLDTVQREMRETEGTTVIIYDQMCATEKRRKRKRGLMVDPAKRTYIHPLVCEGCGDCGIQSNCVSILPKATEFGRKREIDQHSCNKDFSCVNGFCPSFVTVHGGGLRPPEAPPLLDLPLPPEPVLPSLVRPWGIVLAGVGGSGVLTVSAVLGMAAHIEGKGCTVLDMMGLAQKGGAVTSHIRVAASPSDTRSARIPPGAADLALGCDMMTLATDEPLSAVGLHRTQVIVNTADSMTGEFTRSPDLQMPVPMFRQRIEQAAGGDSVEYIDALGLTKANVGDPVVANMFILGYAYQRGLVPVAGSAIEKSMELNGVAVELNRNAFRAGRRAAFDDTAMAPPATPDEREHVLTDLPGIVATRVDFLTGYQNAGYAARYAALVERVRAAERKACGDDMLAIAVARNYFKLLAYKDEYEVARLFVDPSFNTGLQAQFRGDYKLRFHFAPPLLARTDPATGRPKKIAFGGWMLPVLRVMSGLRGLRGTAFDPFGYTHERRTERQLIADYEASVAELVAGLTPDNHEAA